MKSGRGLRYDRHGFVVAPDGTRLFYGVRGSGPNLVLHDGIGCDGWAWSRLHDRLAARHTVIHWHYRGHGRSESPRSPERIGIADLAEDAVALLEQLGVESAIHLGHSMGVQVALEVCRRAPDRVRALILACGSYGRIVETFHGSPALGQFLPDLIAAAKKHRGLVRALWGRAPSKLLFLLATLMGELDRHALREEDFRPYIEHFANLDPDLFFAMLERAGEHSAEDLLPSIKVPTLIIAGDSDTFTPPDLSEFMAERISGAEHFVVRGGTHAAPVEQPEVFALRIEKFFRERHL